MNPLAVGKAVQAGVVAVLGQAVIGRKASRRKSRKVLSDAFSVLLPLALDRPPGPVRLFHRQKAHDQPGVNEKFYAGILQAAAKRLLTLASAAQIFVWPRKNTTLAGVLPRRFFAMPPLHCGL